MRPQLLGMFLAGFWPYKTELLAVLRGLLRLGSFQRQTFCAVDDIFAPQMLFDVA